MGDLQQDQPTFTKNMSAMDIIKVPYEDRV